MGRWAVLAALAAGLLWSIPARADYFGQNKVQYRTYQWHEFSSDHFEVYTYPGLDSVALRVLDLAEKANVYLSHRMGHQLGRKVPIILYGTHNDFAQTNVTPELIEGSTGGFTEVYRNRVVVPFTGSYEDLRHVLVHELVHANMFDLLYAGGAGTLIARQGFFAPPLWFAEGLAEYLSLGQEPNEEMFLRDGTLEGYLPPLEYSGGYIVYKQGQSALRYLVDRYGEDRLRDLLIQIRNSRNFDHAFQRSIGTSVSQFDEQWREWLRKRYWPTVATKSDPERFARRLTDHRRDGSNLNTAPAISPDGDRIVYYSDRRQYTDVYVMSAFDGQQKRRLIRGEQSVKFESVPSFRSSLAWSPDGNRIAMTAKSQGRDVLYIVRASDGKIERMIKPPCEALAYPAWSPRSPDSLIVCGVHEGRSDLYLVDLQGRVRMERLTNDAWDEKEPVWRPDGNGITFSSDRAAPVVLHALRMERGYGRYAIYSIVFGDPQIHEEVRTGGDDHSPAWSPDGTRLAFISDFNGTPNAFMTRPGDSTVVQLTDVRGGIMSLSWSLRSDRVVFTAFDRGGFDVFVAREPLSSPGMMEKIRRAAPAALISLSMSRTAPVDTMKAWDDPTAGALGGAWTDSLALAADTLAHSANPLAGQVTALEPHHAVFDSTHSDPDPPAASIGAHAGSDSTLALLGNTPADSTHAILGDTHAGSDSTHAGAGTHAASDSTMARSDSTHAGPPRRHGDYPHWSGGSADAFAGGGGGTGFENVGALPDSGPPLPTLHPLSDGDGPFALSDTVLSQKPSKYRARFSADFAGGQVYGGSFGVLGATQLSLSDFLGDQRLDMAVGLYSNSIADANVLVTYTYLPRRVDYSFTVFHYKDYFQSRVTALGEAFASPKLFSDRNYGAAVGLAYPTSRFRRFEVGAMQNFVDRTFYAEDQFGYLQASGNAKRSVTALTFSLIGDYTLWGEFGPVNGRRYNLTYQESFDITPQSLPYHTITADSRRYWDLTHGYTFANRMLGGWSDGPAAQTFRIGGFSTLRGYDDYTLYGTRIAVMNTEFRFPFIQQMGLVGPLPLGFFNMKGAAFTDMGLHWNAGYSPRPVATAEDGSHYFQDLRFDFGAGIRTYVFYVPLRVDVAWRWDMQNTSQPRWQVVLGPDF